VSRPRTKADPLTDFSRSSFRHDGVARVIYEKGEGPPVLVMHEIPGITPEVADFARRVVDAGYRVTMPVLFGTPGKPFGMAYNLQELARACIAREFTVLGLRRSSPVTVWLRALCRHLHAEHGGRGVGAIGMCLTGNFALALMVEPCLMAPVLSQPSLPFRASPWHSADLHVSDADLTVIKQRAQAGCPVLGLRIRTDPMVPGRRFDRLRQELGDAFIDVTLDLGPQGGVSPIPHSVVTTEYRDDLLGVRDHPTHGAMQAVLDLFDRQLRPPPGQSPPSGPESVSPLAPDDE